MLSAPRGAMQAITRSVRAYFAPVNRASSTPAYFDPAQSAAFSSEVPSSPFPFPWIYAGHIEKFSRTSLTKYEAIASGAKGAGSAQVRSGLAAAIEFQFLEWGKLQLALSCGSQVLNVLEEFGVPFPAPSGAVAKGPAALLPGSTAQEIVIGLGNVDAFAIGDIIAVDVNYQGQTGFVGTGVAAAYIKDAAQVGGSVDYIRRVTFNVGRVRQKSANSLILTQPLAGGVPLASAQVQRVRAFVEREGGSFVQEWSALFVAESETGALVFFHYPRVQPAHSGTEANSQLANAFDAWSLPVKLIALPTTDTNDSEQVLCYRSLVPAPNTEVF